MASPYNISEQVAKAKIAHNMLKQGYDIPYVKKTVGLTLIAMERMALIAKIPTKSKQGMEVADGFIYINPHDPKRAKANG